MARPKNSLSADSYVKGIMSGDITVLSKAITLIESKLRSDLEFSQEIIEQCLPHSGNSIRIAVSGIPGAGKSSFIDVFGSLLTKEFGKKVAVLTVDPSSQISKGSILGDKVRMDKLSTDENAYIRPSPSSGSLGGVTRSTRESIILCEAAGFDVIIIETVGVGQSEITVRSMVDFFLLLHLSGTGDELQGIKRGIIEIADAIAVNKCDGDNVKKAELAKKEIENAVHLFHQPESGWQTRVMTCSAIKSTGIEEIWSMIEEYIGHVKGNGFFERNRNQQSKSWLYETITNMLEESFYSADGIEKEIKLLEKEVTDGKINTFHAATKLLKLFKSSLKDKD